MENGRNVFTFLEKTTNQPSDAESFSSVSSLEEENQLDHSYNVATNKPQAKQDSRTQDMSSQSDVCQKGQDTTKHSSHCHAASGQQPSETGKDGETLLPESLEEKHKRSSRHTSLGKRRHSLSDRVIGSASESQRSPHKHKQSQDSHVHSSDSGNASKLRDRRSSSSSSKGQYNHLYKHVLDIPLIVNATCGYITSPDISSEEEEDEARSQSATSPLQRQDSLTSAPVELSRHALKPTLDRYGGSFSEREKILTKLQAIRSRINSNEPPSRKRAARGEVKRRRAKREHLEGDFTGSCLEKIEYNEEEKPSLKRPEPKPEPEKKEKPKKPEKVEKPKKDKKEAKKEKQKKEETRRKTEKCRKSGKEADRRLEPRHRKRDNENRDSKHEEKCEQTDKERKKAKHKHRHQPPPVSFTDLMKMAGQKQTSPSSSTKDGNQSVSQQKSAHRQKKHGKEMPGFSRDIASIRNVWDSLFGKSKKEEKEAAGTREEQKRVFDEDTEKEDDALKDKDGMVKFINDEECGTNVPR